MGFSEAINIIKIKIVQCLIQIERPKNWNEDNITKIIKEVMYLEKYNAIKNKTLLKFEKKWKSFFHLT
jgi:hypothetical protein